MMDKNECRCNGCYQDAGQRQENMVGCKKCETPKGTDASTTPEHVVAKGTGQCSKYARGNADVALSESVRSGGWGKI